MNIANKLSIIILTLFQASIMIWAAFELSKGATFHQLNSLHLKYNVIFSRQLNDIKEGGVISILELKASIDNIRQQPVQCLNNVNLLDRVIMQQIGTAYALQLCEKDIMDADQALAALQLYAANNISRKVLLDKLSMAVEAFNENSNRFEKPITQTVSFIVSSMIPMVIFISLFNILFITYLSRNICSSIAQAIDLLSSSATQDDLMVNINNNVSGELHTLLVVARERLEKDLQSRETNQQLGSLVEQRTQSLQRANDELAQFAYRASHDLKAPLTTSKCLATLVAKDIDAGDLSEARKNALQIEQQMQKLEELLGAILSLTRAEIADEKEQLVDFDSVLDELEQRLSEVFRKHNCLLITEIDDITPFKTEKVRVMHMLENFLSNAAKYSDPDKQQPYVKVKVSETSSDYCLQVEDNGLGFPESRTNEIFQMFKRFHPNVSHGSGLGMSIIKRHIDFFKGHIDWVSSTNGTTFTVVLPK